MEMHSPRTPPSRGRFPPFRLKKLAGLSSAATTGGAASPGDTGGLRIQHSPTGKDAADGGQKVKSKKLSECGHSRHIDILHERCPSACMQQRSFSCYGTTVQAARLYSWALAAHARTLCLALPPEKKVIGELAHLATPRM
eukprot:scaffold36193_cov49-Prasinocladus_malaysianus.AAC.3